MTASGHEIWIIITRLKHTCIKQNMNHYNQGILPRRNKFYSRSSKKKPTCTLIFSELFKSIFFILLAMEALSLYKV